MEAVAAVFLPHDDQVAAVEEKGKQDHDKDHEDLVFRRQESLCSLMDVACDLLHSFGTGVSSADFPDQVCRKAQGQYAQYCRQPV